MQPSYNRKASIDSCSTADPEVLDSGLYCDFARRGSLLSAASEPSTTAVVEGNGGKTEQVIEEEPAASKSPWGIVKKFMKGTNLKGELGESWGKTDSSASNTSNMSHNSSQKAQAMETETGAVTVKVKGNKPRGPRRGSHAMMGMPAGQKMPTSAELMAAKQQQQAASPAAEPLATSSKPSKPRGPRRGSHAMMGMPAGQKMPTSAELMAAKQQGQLPQAGTPTASSTPTMKVKGNKPGRVSHMMPEAQGQMENLTVTCTPMDVSDQEQSKPSSSNDEADEYGYGEGSPSPSSSGGGGRARRRGSVVRTIMDNEKNVDGDGHYRAHNNTELKAKREFDSSVKMENVDDIKDEDDDDNHFLPQRRASHGVDEASGSKRAMLKQDSGAVGNADDYGE